MRVLACTTLCFAACAFDPAGPGDPAPDPTRSPADVDAAATPPPTAPYDVECHVDGDRVGVTGLRVKVGDATITFDHWTPDPEQTGDYIGFTLSANAAGLSYGVSTGDWIYYAAGVAWSVPSPSHSQIERIDFCW